MLHGIWHDYNNSFYFHEMALTSLNVYITSKVLGIVHGRRWNHSRLILWNLNHSMRKKNYNQIESSSASRLKVLAVSAVHKGEKQDVIPVIKVHSIRIYLYVVTFIRIWFSEVSVLQSNVLRIFIETSTWQ